MLIRNFNTFFLETKNFSIFFYLFFLCCVRKVQGPIVRFSSPIKLHSAKQHSSNYGFYNKKADKKGKVLGPSFLILLKEYDT